MFSSATRPKCQCRLKLAVLVSSIVYFKEMFAPPVRARRRPTRPGSKCLAPILVGLNPFERYISVTQWIVGQSAEGPSVADWILMLGLKIGMPRGGVWCSCACYPMFAITFKVLYRVGNS